MALLWYQEEKTFQNHIELNCTSVNSTISSLALILSVTEEKLRDILREVPETPQNETPEYYVPERVFAATHPPNFPVQSLWFHASRVADPQFFFREGILTKSDMQPRLRRYLEKLSSGLTHRGKNPFSGSIFGKAQINDNGPFAFLIRSIAVHAPGATHNYSESPESVEDIAGELLGGNCAQLVDRFKQNTIPCIVASRAFAEEYAVSHAVFYAYLNTQGVEKLEAADVANTCYDGEGRAIPPEDVVSVDQLD